MEAKKYEGILSQYRPPLCYELVGKIFTLVMDNGYDYVLSFEDKYTLTYGMAGQEPSTYAYECLKGDDTTYLLVFEVDGVSPRQGMTFVLDTEQSLTTCLIAYQGKNPKLPGLVTTEVVFGAIQREDGTTPMVRHGYTTDLLGKAIYWNYGAMEVIHVYCTEHYYSLTMTEAMREDMAKRDPARLARIENGAKNGYPFCEEPVLYIKIKDGLILFSFIEENQYRRLGIGYSLCVLINTHRMTDVGRAFGLSENNIPFNYTFGAYGKFADPGPVLDRESVYYIR